MISNRQKISKAKILTAIVLGLLPILFSTQIAQAATPVPTLDSPLSNTTYDEIPISYVLPAAPLSGTEEIIFSGATTYTLTLNDNSPGTYSFTLNPKNVFASSNVFSEIPSSAIADGTYNVVFSYQDSSGDPAATSTVATNVVINTSSPGISVTALSPANSTSNTGDNPTLTMTFNQPVVIGTGNLYIHKASDGSIVEEIPITSANVSGGGSNTISATLPTPLTNGTTYYVTLDSGALNNQTGSSFGGISTPTTWRFSTIAVETSNGTVGTSDPDTGYGTPTNNSNSIILGLTSVALVSIGGGVALIYRRKA